MGKFNFNQKVSSSLALILIFILSFVVAWVSLSIGSTIVASAPQSMTFNPEKRIPQQLP